MLVILASCFLGGYKNILLYIHLRRKWMSKSFDRDQNLYEKCYLYPDAFWWRCKILPEIPLKLQEPWIIIEWTKKNCYEVVPTQPCVLGGYKMFTLDCSHLAWRSLSTGILWKDSPGFCPLLLAQHVSGIVLVDCHYYYSVINSNKHAAVVEAAQFVYNVLTVTMVDLGAVTSRAKPL